MIALGQSSYITFGVINHFYYTNHRGERRLRRMIPLCLRFGTTQYHKDAQWLLECLDCERIADYRTLTLKDVEILHTSGAEMEPEDASHSTPDAKHTTDQHDRKSIDANHSGQ